ncbi:hypothetical protein L596_027111 [Steinernema carpocapsae]|uniref:C2H2-type domain-containing protein n=1 Tax=Steinernema carpocapsae TaxID=34508 RepID=A0A4U5M3H9_STECR|nr:hypothetical protein L596_027111 [Steinernema carpocapsae]
MPISWNFESKSKMLNFCSKVDPKITRYRRDRIIPRHTSTDFVAFRHCGTKNATVGSKFIEIREIFVDKRQQHQLPAPRSSDQPRKPYERFLEKQFEQSFTLKQNVQQHIVNFHGLDCSSPDRESFECRMRRFQCMKCLKIFKSEDVSSISRRHTTSPSRWRNGEEEQQTLHALESSHAAFEALAIRTAAIQAVEVDDVLLDVLLQGEALFELLLEEALIRLASFVIPKIVLIFELVGTCASSSAPSAPLPSDVAEVFAATSRWSTSARRTSATYEGCEHPGYKCSKALAAHVRAVHTGERPYECSQCERAFVRKNDLKVHEATHSRIVDLRCQYCGAAFRRDNYLKKHYRVCEKKNRRRIAHPGK